MVWVNDCFKHFFRCFADLKGGGDRQFAHGLK